MREGEGAEDAFLFCILPDMVKQYQNTLEYVMALNMHISNQRYSCRILFYNQDTLPLNERQWRLPNSIKLESPL